MTAILGQLYSRNKGLACVCEHVIVFRVHPGHSQLYRFHFLLHATLKSWENEPGDEANDYVLTGPVKKP